MALASLTEYLDQNHVQYVIITHSPAYTAQGIAGLTHISGKELAKTVIVKLDEKLVMAVLPANYHVDLVALKRALKAKTVELASEEEFKDRFAECETGAKNWPSPWCSASPPATAFRRPDSRKLPCPILADVMAFRPPRWETRTSP